MEAYPPPPEPNTTSAQASYPALPPPPTAPDNSKRNAIIMGLVVLAILVLTGLAVYFLYQPETPTNKIRDIFIIFMAVQSLVIGFTLVVLIVQMARLINLLQNEIKPILDSTNDSMNTLRGTITFISDNLAEPVIKVNETLAAFKQLGDFFKFTKGKK